MGDAGSNGHFEFASDGIEKGFMRKGLDDTGGADDGEPVDHADPVVEGSFRQFLAAGDADRHIQSAGVELAQFPFHHLARNGIDGRTADLDTQPGKGDGSDALTADKTDVGMGVTESDLCRDDHSVGDIGIVAGLFPYADGDAVIGEVDEFDREGESLPIRQRDLDPFIGFNDSTGQREPF